jgi:hypothetical protein
LAWAHEIDPEAPTPGNFYGIEVVRRAGYRDVSSIVKRSFPETCKSSSIPDVVDPVFLMAAGNTDYPRTYRHSNYRADEVYAQALARVEELRA